MVNSRILILQLLNSHSELLPEQNKTSETASQSVICESAHTTISRVALTATIPLQKFPNAILETIFHMRETASLGQLSLGGPAVG